MHDDQIISERCDFDQTQKVGREHQATARVAVARPAALTRWLPRMILTSRLA